MPKVHQRVDGSGHYIKSSFEGVIVTYQVTPQGEQHLKKKRIGEGTTITTDELLWMQKKGYIYTGGSGPGAIEPGTPLFKAKPKKKRRKNKSGCCCCSSAVVIVAIVPATILSTIVLVRHHQRQENSLR
ncbi:MAG TPA: hypothetical protein PLD25_08450 [Chloroflexota bacterium]|nr:hypothetical protein [Chloroflexota bacterium]HUM68874.1 hypothetical protein [Chloroflexota bacterium]